LPAQTMKATTHLEHGVRDIDSTLHNFRYRPTWKPPFKSRAVRRIKRKSTVRENRACGANLLAQRRGWQSSVCLR
jgi:hypothetical protein